jgi:hypothetical protein
MKHDLFQIKETKSNEEQRVPMKYLQGSRNTLIKVLLDSSSLGPPPCFSCHPVHQFIISFLVLFYFKYIFGFGLL